ncbi:MAG TPA: hypothetical protein VM051_00085 [Usitatibacter sp.]|nr:hypothetical protein [Usitatibacter sp.]
MNTLHAVLVLLLAVAVAALVRRGRDTPGLRLAKLRPRAPSRPGTHRAHVAHAARPPDAPLPSFEFNLPTIPNLAAKLRDRYIAARFPAMFGGGSALANPANVVRVARLYFEEGKADRAQELLGLASKQAPGEATIRLAQLELAFLARDATRYLACAKDFREALPDRLEWADITRLGFALTPEEPLFAGARDTRAHAHAHYGPWPDTPNWIQASWDLTSDVLAADFHAAAMAQSTEEAA